MYQQITLHVCRSNQQIEQNKQDSKRKNSNEMKPQFKEINQTKL